MTMSQHLSSAMTIGRALAVFGAALAVASPAALAGGRAKVWISDEQPLVVRGSGFHPAAEVTVVVAKVKHIYKTSVVTNTIGGFTARFHSNLPKCGSGLVTASDADGRHASAFTVANDCGGIRVPPT